MNLTDTHAHLYLGDFATDIDLVMKRAEDTGVSRIFLPNIDRTTVDAMLSLSARYPGRCFPMMGLHPCSVKDGYRDELDVVAAHLDGGGFVAVGETGIDLYRDKSTQGLQEEAFRRQILLAKKHDLPVVVHCRESLELTLAILEEMAPANPPGILHCFSGTAAQAERAAALGFSVGLGGVITFPKAALDAMVRGTDLKNIVLETDAPYLAPVPYRGKRNESAWLVQVAEKVAALKGISAEEVAERTTDNARRLFNV